MGCQSEFLRLQGRVRSREDRELLSDYIHATERLLVGSMCFVRL